MQKRLAEQLDPFYEKKHNLNFGKIGARETQYTWLEELRNTESKRKRKHTWLY